MTPEVLAIVSVLLFFWIFLENGDDE